METQAPQEDRLLKTGQIRLALEGLMQINRYQWNEQGTLLLYGQLLQPSEQIFPTIRKAVEAQGFTPFLERIEQEDTLMAIPVVIERKPARLLLPALLFIATIITTVITGAMYRNIDLMQNPAGIIAGFPFALTLMGILSAHEMGHYVVGRLRGAPVSLPYFIPVPPPLSITGTMGAVIVQREPMEDRRTIIEIGLAGPFAGLLVAIPLLLYGLSTSSVGPPATSGYLQEGNSILYAAMKFLVFGKFLPGNGLDVQLNDIAWGAWIGLLITMFNLLPVGQLDGGHAAYALLGPRASYLSYGVTAICIALGVTVSQVWLFWGVMSLVFGMRHPKPFNDIAPLRPIHMLLAILGLITFILLFMPAPLTIVGP